MTKHQPKVVEGFRVLQFPACAVAFADPREIDFEGSMISGAANKVRIRVASLSDFIIMKAHALERRDKPKDVYDICYYLDRYSGDLVALAADWRARTIDPLVEGAVRILAEKFGPRWPDTRMRWRSSLITTS